MGSVPPACPVCSTRSAPAAPAARAVRSSASAAGGPTVAAMTRARQRPASRSACSSAAKSAGLAPLARGPTPISPVSGSTVADCQDQLKAATISRWPASAGPVDNAITTVRVAPGDRALAVAHLIAGATLEALFVVEQDPAIGGGYEKAGRAGVDALLRGARAAHPRVHRDMRPLPHPELDGGHPVLEGHAGILHLSPLSN